MTSHEPHGLLVSAGCTAKVRATPRGEVEVVAEEAGGSAYGPVEIAWYSDHLEITALGAGRASVTKAHPNGDDQDVVVEIRPPALDELTETVPGAD